MNQQSHQRFVPAVLGVLLLIGAFLLYWPVHNFEFINCDDQDYITENQHVKTGWSKENFVWAFTAYHAANWHPLTWLSLMTDAQLFGDSSGAFHLTNAALHAITAALLFLVLRALTGTTWRSALVAALFAVHPLHVESVAWVSERKDVLCAFFWVLTMGAYCRYARNPGWTRYIWVTGFMALALLSKPMAVSLPIVLLLLDWWPLRRIDLDKSDWFTKVRTCAFEKLPLLFLSAASSVVTVRAQKAGGAVAGLESLTLDTRIINAIESYGRYLQQTFWPTKLAIFYPYSRFADTTAVTVAILIVASVTFAAIYLRRRMPYLALGWMWYLVTLVPVIGVVQVGMQARADRYTYIPLIGIFIAIAWLAADFAAKYRSLKPGVVVASIGTVTALMFLCAAQIQYWRNSVTLFEHTLAVTGKNAFAHQALGSALIDKGDLEGGARHFEEAVSINPEYISSRNNLVALLIQKGHYKDAIAQCEEILRIAPSFHIARLNLAKALDLSGKKTEAAARYEEFLENNPADAEARMLYALCLVPPAASAEYQVALSLVMHGQHDLAIPHYREALRLQPRFPAALNDLAWILATHPDATLRNGTEAVKLAETACQLTEYKQAYCLGTLDAAYAEVERFDDAIATAQKAQSQAKAASQPEIIALAEKRIEIYKTRQPYHQTLDEVRSHAKR